MNTDMGSKVDTARYLSWEIRRIGELGSDLPKQASGTSIDDQTSIQYEGQLPRNGALPVLAPNSLADKVIRVTVVDAATKKDLCEIARLSTSYRC